MPAPTRRRQACGHCGIGGSFSSGSPEVLLLVSLGSDRPKKWSLLVGHPKESQATKCYCSTDRYSPKPGWTHGQMRHLLKTRVDER